MNFVAFFFIDFTVYSNGWYHMNVVLVFDWINVLHSIGMADMSLSYVYCMPCQIKLCIELSEGR